MSELAEPEVEIHFCVDNVNKVQVFRSWEGMKISEINIITNKKNP